MGKAERTLDGDKCIHCHLCRKHCTFLQKYEIDIGDTERLKELAYHCFLCGTCSAVCPKGIDGRGIVLEMRRDEVRKNHGRLKEKGCGLLLAEKQNYLFRNESHGRGKSVLFPGCNFPSFYPETTKLLIRMLKEKADMGVIFDCCGKPVGELGLLEREEVIVRRLGQSMERAGAEEAVMVCPNCYDFLKGRLPVRVVSIYEKLEELGLGSPVRGRIPLFLPCPDREERAWLSWLRPFLLEEPEIFEGAQCCGLGGLAGRREPELSRAMARAAGERGISPVYVYCASCAGNLSRGGCGDVRHLLPEILGSREKPDEKRSLWNRAKMKFW